MKFLFKKENSHREFFFIKKVVLYTLCIYLVVHYIRALYVAQSAYVIWFTINILKLFMKIGLNWTLLSNLLDV